MQNTNNVNVGRMREFVDAVRDEPDLAKKHKRVTGRWVFEEGRPQFVSTLEHPGGVVGLNCELPPFAGGWGTSPDPVQYCLYGVCACVAATFAATAAGEGVELTRLEVTAENWLDLRKQMGLSTEDIIRKVRLTVSAGGAPKDDLERIMRLTEERCPGVECLTRAVPFEIEMKG